MPDNSIDFFIGRVWHYARAIDLVKRGNSVGAEPVQCDYVISS